MPTDTFGVAGWQRYIAGPVSCNCNRIYTEFNKPPWGYESIGFVANPVEWWEFAEQAWRLLPVPNLELCEFNAVSFDPFENVLYEVRLLISKNFSPPYEMIANLFLKHDTLISQQRVGNQVDLTALYGDRLPRGVNITFPFNTWYPIFQTFPAAALPSITLIVSPRFCTPGIPAELITPVP